MAELSVTVSSARWERRRRAAIEHGAGDDAERSPDRQLELKASSTGVAQRRLTASSQFIGGLWRTSIFLEFSLGASACQPHFCHPFHQ